MKRTAPPRSIPSALRGAASGLLVLLVLAWPAQAADPADTAADAELRARIEARLAALPGREGANIQVAVRDGQVLLYGSVPLLEQSLRAEQATWKTDGVVDVDNELRVFPLGVSDDAAIERQVRLIIKGENGFIDTNLQVEVTGGLVRLRGLFQDPADLLALKHRIASIPGVLGVEIRARLVADARPSHGHGPHFANRRPTC